MRWRAEPCAHECYKHLHQYGAGRASGSAEGHGTADSRGRGAEAGGVHVGRLVRKLMKTHAVSEFQTVWTRVFPRKKSLAQLDGFSQVVLTVRKHLEVNLNGSLICLCWLDHLSCWSLMYSRPCWRLFCDRISGIPAQRRCFEVTGPDVVQFVSIRMSRRLCLAVTM